MHPSFLSHRRPVEVRLSAGTADLDSARDASLQALDIASVALTRYHSTPVAFFLSNCCMAITIDSFRSQIKHTRYRVES